jgi:hypothetical protein
LVVRSAVARRLRIGRRIWQRGKACRRKEAIERWLVAR